MTHTITSFRDLMVWKKSMDLAVRAYRRTAKTFPREDRMVLGYQIRKSSVSMPSNIAEGFSRHFANDYIQHLWTAHGSGAELETQVELGHRLDLIRFEDATVLIEHAQEIARMINGLVGSLKSQRSRRRW